MTRRSFLKAPAALLSLSEAPPQPTGAVTIPGYPGDKVPGGVVRVRFSATADPALRQLFDDLAAARRRARECDEQRQSEQATSSGGAGPAPARGGSDGSKERAETPNHR